MKVPLQIPIIIERLKVIGPQASREVDMIFDTGARYTSFSWDTLKDIGYDPAVSPERIPVITANGSIEVPLLKVYQIVWGDIVKNNVPIICHNIPKLVGVDGLVGLSFLQHFEINLNFKKGILEIK
jgi:clan AA aspartic protease (TIGR02281 family)